MTWTRPWGRRLLAAACGMALAAGMATSAATAAVAPDPPRPPEFNGYNLTPSQAGGAGNAEWLGSYRVNGKQVWCVNYLHKAPRSNERYRPGETLRTKWNTPIPAKRAADISYLLLRHGNTDSNAEATAMAHILHSWTAPAGPGHPTDGVSTRQLAYDEAFHLRTMPAEARKKVRELTREAAANRGPWRAELTKPDGEQVLGTPADWTVTVRNAKGDGVPNVPVTFSATDGTLSPALGDAESEQPAAPPSGQAPDARQAERPAPAPQAGTGPTGADAGASARPAATEQTEPAERRPAGTENLRLRTGADGTATVALTPTGEKPSLATSFASPNQKPRVQQPLRGDVQKVVLTGGEQQVTQTSTSTARQPAGEVRVRKVDAETGKPIAGASLRITGPDRKGAALDADGERLLGADGAPTVVQTRRDGTATVDDLRAPQEICVVEAAAPPGYEERFDRRNPPSACGTIDDGGTLTLTVRNQPNAPEVPITIPAGDGDAVVANAALQDGTPTGALVGLGAGVLLAAGLGTLLVRGRGKRQR